MKWIIQYNIQVAYLLNKKIIKEIEKMGKPNGFPF